MAPATALRYACPVSTPSNATFRARVARHRPKLIVGAVILALLAAFLKLGSEVAELEFDALDRAVLASLRDADGTPIGPLWLARSMLDVTALGSGTVATIVTTIAVLYLVLARRRALALVVAVAAIGGWGVMALAKGFYARPRPDATLAIDLATGLSFPSGHTIAATAVYLTIGSVVARAIEPRVQRIYILCVAATLAVVVGFSRVYLGVHYLTDVLGGWLVGGAWALLWGAVAAELHQREKAQ